MSVSKFNELGNSARNRVASGQIAGLPDSQSADTTSSIQQGGKASTRAGSPLGAGIDWFSQLDSGTAHPMKATNQFGTNPPIDTIVDKIMSNLDLTPGSD